MDIHNLTNQEKKEQRAIYIKPDFPYAYSVSLGEWPCNRACRMCPMSVNPVKKARYITDDVFERACRVLGEREANYEISAYGETFHHPHADEYLFLARRLCPNSRIVVATNGTLLDRERCEKIVDSGIDHLSFSLDAGSAESYAWLTQSNDYDNVCKNLETLVEIRNRHNAKHLYITTHIIGIKQLAHEFDSFVKRWTGIVDAAVVRNFGNWAGLVDETQVTAVETQKIPEARYPCVWLWYATKIEPDGNVSKCFIHVVGQKDPLGNVMKQSFESIWKGPKLNRYRELHLKNRYHELEHCENCMVWSLFPNFWEEKRRWVLFGDKMWA